VPGGKKLAQGDNKVKGTLGRRRLGERQEGRQDSQVKPKKKLGSLKPQGDEIPPESGEPGKKRTRSTRGKAIHYILSPSIQRVAPKGQKKGRRGTLNDEESFFAADAVKAKEKENKNVGSGKKCW